MLFVHSGGWLEGHDRTVEKHDQASGWIHRASELGSPYENDTVTITYIDPTPETAFKDANNVGTHKSG